MKPLSGKEMAKLLEAHGWQLGRVHGSHHVYVKAGKRERLSVPIHAGKLLKPGLQRYLLKTAGIEEDAL